ncbi:hypothetical protein FKM82_015346 [Ascaphus truei]
MIKLYIQCTDKYSGPFCMFYYRLYHFIVVIFPPSDHNIKNCTKNLIWLQSFIFHFFYFSYFFPPIIHFFLHQISPPSPLPPSFVAP